MPLLGAMCHVGVTVRDLDDAMQFFTPFLEFLGYEIWDEVRNPYGQRVRITVNHGNGAVFQLWEAKPELARHPFEVGEVGLHSVAFYTDTHEQVDRACELAKRLGAKILDGPGELPYDPEGWYEVSFLGPDGLRFEVVHQPSSVKRYEEMMRIAEQLMKH